MNPAPVSNPVPLTECSMKRWSVVLLWLCLLALVVPVSAQDTFVTVTDVVGGIYHLPLANCPTQGLTYTRSTNAFGCVSGSSAPAAGSNTQVQFNDSGVLGGDAGFTYVKATDTATLGALVLTTALPATSGGTGFASYAVGDLLYASTTTALARLADVATGQVLVSGGANTAPAYSATPSVTSVTLSGATGNILIADSPTLVVDATNHRVGILTTTPSSSLSLGGNAARTLAMERHSTADTAGNGLTVSAGGATVGATNRAGGQLSLSAGQSTGSGLSILRTFVYGIIAASTSDNTQIRTSTTQGWSESGVDRAATLIDGMLQINNQVVAYTTDTTLGTTARMYGTASTGGAYPFTAAGHFVIQARPDAARDIVFATGTSPATRLVISSGGNIGINATTFGTSAAAVLALAVGTAPSTSPADTVQLWEADRGGTAGKGALNLRTEDGTSHVFGDLVGIGTLTPGSLLHVAETSTSAVRGVLSAQYSASTDGGRVIGRKARGTLAAPTIVTTGDTLASWIAEGYDGAAYLQMGAILINSIGTIASNRVPTAMVFQTATDAATSVLTTALTLNKDQTATFAAGITGTTLSGTGIVTALSGTAPVAAGSQAVQLNSTAAFGIYTGSGAPTISAAKGSIYLRTDGSGVADRAYINTNGSTTWTAIATAG